MRNMPPAKGTKEKAVEGANRLSRLPFLFLGLLLRFLLFGALGGLELRRGILCVLRWLRPQRAGPC